LPLSILTAATYINTLSENLNALKISPDNEKNKNEILTQIKTTPSLIDTLINEAMDKNKEINYRCSLIEILSSSDSDYARKSIVPLLKENNYDLNICVAKISGHTKNSYMTQNLLDNIEEFLFSSYKGITNKGIAEQNLKQRISAIDSIWALGKIGDPKVMSKLEEFYNMSDEVLRINIIFSIGKLKNKKALIYLNKIAENEKESYAVRSAAFEMIEELGNKGGEE
jgi:HEAT repeat protein